MHLKYVMSHLLRTQRRCLSNLITPDPHLNYALTIFLARIASGSPDLSAGLPPLPVIDDSTISARVFTHRSLYMRSTTLFQDPDNGKRAERTRKI